MLEIERILVLCMFPRSYWPEVHKAYDLMMETRATSAFGTLYTKVGGRQSGDLTTSIGNGLLNRFAVWMCLRKLPSKAWASFHEGDDGLIGVDEEYLDEALEALNFLWSVGFQGKIDVYNSLHQTSFCGRFLAETPDGLKSYADPLRTMTKLHTTCSSGKPKELMCAKALSYLHTDSFVPIIGPWASVVSEVLLREVGRVKARRALVRLLHTREIPWHLRSYLLRKGTLNEDNVDDCLSSRPAVVDEELRGLYALRTGISIRQQLDMERRLEEWRDGITTIPPIEVAWVWKPNCHYNINPDIRT